MENGVEHVQQNFGRLGHYCGLITTFQVGS